MKTAEAGLLLKASRRLGESIMWHDARQMLYWTDLPDPGLYGYDLRTGKVMTKRLDLPPPIGSAVVTTDPDKLILNHRGGLSLIDLDDLSMTPYCDPESGRDAVIYNDLKTDRWGRLWVGTSHEKELENRGALWCVRDRKTWTLGDVGFPVSNGPAFSPDGMKMYFNDSANYRTFAYDVSPDDLKPRNRSLFASYTVEEGMPDGLTVDADGCIWTAQWAGARVIRLSPVGEKLLTLHVPTGHVTSVAFGGPGLAELFITTAHDGLTPEQKARYPLSGSLFSYTPGVGGIAEPVFAEI
jgi:sugar lactone lactonase YvrE